MSFASVRSKQGALLHSSSYTLHLIVLRVRLPRYNFTRRVCCGTGQALMSSLVQPVCVRFLSVSKSPSGAHSQLHDFQLAITRARVNLGLPVKTLVTHCVLSRWLEEISFDEKQDKVGLLCVGVFMTSQLISLSTQGLFKLDECEVCCAMNNFLAHCFTLLVV